MPLQLHIFEERYRQMIAHCRVNNSPFGVVLIKHGAEANGPLAEPHMVGCTAHIAQLLPLQGGRYNLVAAGHDRFRIHELLHDRPYLVGLVEDAPLNPGDPLECGQAEDALRPWMGQYFRLIVPPDELENLFSHVPDDPVRLAYLAAVVLQVPPVQKQIFLDTDDCTQLLNILTQAYRRETAIVQRLAEIPAREQARGFSVN